MTDDRHTSMASLAPHHTSKCDLHHHPQPSQITSLHANLPSRLLSTPHRVNLSGRQHFADHCQCFATREPHSITTHHNKSCFVHMARTCFAYVCLPALPRPCAWFVRDLLACTFHLIADFLCKQTSASLRVSVLVDVDVTVGVRRGCLGAFVCVQKQIQDPSRSLVGITRVHDTSRPGCLIVQ